MDTTTAGDGLLRVHEAADRLAVSTDTIYALVAEGRLEHVRIGTGRGTIRFTEAAIRRYIEAQTRPAEHP